MGTVDRPLNVGFLGTGYIADWHAKALRSVHGTRLAAVCDRDEARVRAFAARHGVARVYTSLSAMLSEGGLDVIHVLLPPELHAQTAAESRSTPASTSCLKNRWPPASDRVREPHRTSPVEGSQDRCQP